MFGRRRAALLAGATALAAVGLVLGLVVGVGRGGQATEDAYGYPAKVLCGVLSYTHPDTGATINIDLKTAVNVHNPTGNYVTIHKKGVLALPETDTPESPGELVEESIPPDGAFEIDCSDVRSLLSHITSLPDLVKGFVVIESPVEIDVVGVYTAQRVVDGNTPGVGHAIEVDTIEARDLPPAAVAAGLVATYPAKFVCGLSDGDPSWDALVSGTYFTAVNVHNPNTSAVDLEKKVVLSWPERCAGACHEPTVTRFFPYHLEPNEAFEIDCADIEDLMAASGVEQYFLWEYLKGFVVVAAPAELDVVAVYTSTEETAIDGAGGVGLKLDIEPVAEQLVAAKPDLSSSISCEHSSYVSSGVRWMSIYCHLDDQDLDGEIYDWEIILNQQDPPWPPTVTCPFVGEDWWCTVEEGGNAWYPNYDIEPNVKCKDASKFGSYPWQYDECRDIELCLPEDFVPGDTIVLHATDFDQNNLGDFVSPSGTLPVDCQPDD